MRPSTSSRFTLLQSYRSPHSLPPKQMLDDFRSWASRFPDLLEVKTYVDDVGDDEVGVSHLRVGRIGKADIEATLTQGFSEGKTVILLCGPQP